MRKQTIKGVGALLLLLPLLGVAAVPNAGLKAEVEGRWQDALSIYQKSLKKNPKQVDLWLRIADIQASLGNASAASAALLKARRYAPRNANILFRSSQALAVVEDKKAALAAINRAVKLEPKNVEYLRSRAELANWNQDYPTARDSYQRILALKPNDTNAMLELARVHSWLGDKNASAKSYAAYVRRKPDDKVALMEYIEVEAERGDTTAALKLGTRYRQRFGEDQEYWLRMADLYALSGDEAQAARALEQASRYTPDEDALYFRLAQGYAAADDPVRALGALNRALALKPNNIEYLRNHAEVASWAGDYPAAMKSYQRILSLQPQDAGAMLGIARLLSWQGKTDAAIDAYEDYLDIYTQAPPVVWVEYITLLNEVGDYALSMEVLAKYRDNYGDGEEYRKIKARTLAWADRPTRSLAIVDPMLQDAPDDYDLNYTRTIALNNDHRPREALKSLGKLVALQPDSKDTKELQRFIKTPLRSRISLSGAYQEDSDDIRIRRYGVEGVYVASPETELFLGGDRQRLTAPLGSGFETVAGEEQIRYSRGWLGIRHLISRRLSLDLQGGTGQVEGAGNPGIYEVGADFWPHDQLSLRLWRRQDIYAVSPRAVSLEILRRANELDFTWTPDLRWTVDGLIGYSDFSDDNSRTDLMLAPRRAVYRGQWVNVDLGVSGQYLSFDTNPGNGYYAPSTYTRYALNAYTYWKLSTDDAISLTFSLGGYDDDTTDSYRYSGDVTAEGFFGLYRDWMLDVRGTLGQNVGVDTGPYRIGSVELILTRRF
jgi:tetratricopeptide (TPR) repeat protein